MVNFKGPPRLLAASFGIGVAMGVIPGTGAIAAAAVAGIFRLNLALTMAGALVVNPVTSPFVYMGSYLLGHWLLGDAVPAGSISRVLLKTVTGSMVLAVGLGLLGYLLAFGVAASFRNRRAARH